MTDSTGTSSCLYVPFDELTSPTNGAQDAVTHSYDVDGESTGITYPLPSGATWATSDTVSYGYDNADRPPAITLKNSSTALQSFTYSDAPSGNVVSETDTPTSSLSPAACAYDAQGRVTSDTPGTGSAKNYSFDASSNLTALPKGRDRKPSIHRVPYSAANYGREH